MGFLHEIQASLLDEKADLSAVLLKVRLLAAKLGSHPLEEWVKYESEGYPEGVPIPAYRRVSVAYSGDFSDIAKKISNAPIPSYLIAKFADDSWNVREVRESIAGVRELASASKNGTLYLSASNLILMLQGKVYEGMACHSIKGMMSAAALGEIISVVRNRVMDLTIELEKSVPGAAEIALGKSAGVNAAAVTQVINQVFHGDVGAVSTGGSAQINVTINKGDGAALVKALMDAGIVKADAEEFAAIVASEKPESAEQPFGAKAKAWIGANIKKAMDGTWKVGLNVVSGVLTKAALMYYGLDS